MKRLILLNISLFTYVFCMSQSISVLSKDDVPKVFNIAIIDSITNNEKNHCVWLKNQKRPLVYQNGDVSEIVFNDWNNKYCLFSDEENNIEYGFCFDSGSFGVLIPDTLQNNGHFVILGDTLSKKDFIIAHIDSLHLLRNIYDGDFIYNLRYFGKYISIETLNLNTDSIHQYQIDYTDFTTNSQSINTRVSHLTDNRWFQFLNMTSLTIGLRNPDKISMMCDYASIQDNRFINTVGDLGSIALSIKKLNLWQLPISFLSFLDKFEELLYYHGASVETLGAKKNSINSYSLNCIVKDFSNIPIDEYSWLECTMEVYSANNKTPLTQTKVIKSGDTATFVFSDLELNTVYSYKPRVYFTWYENVGNTNISMSDFIMGTSSNFYVTTVQVKCDQYLLGEEKSFLTGSPSCTTGDLVDKSENSAIVTCSYYDVEGFECGVMVTNNEKTFNVSTNSSNGKHEISIMGLSPATTYTYKAYVVDVDGITYFGEDKTFTTDLPDVTGTWTCKEKRYRNNGEEYYETYTVTLHKDGAVTTSLYESFAGARWERSKTDLFVNIDIRSTLYLITAHDLYIKFDDPTNPRRGKGTAEKWTWNATSGASSSKSWELEMTK